MTETYKNFCTNICYLRKIHSLTQKEMARIMEISVSTLRKIEQKQPNVRVTGSMLCRVCDHFQISADAMLNGKLY